MPSTYLPHASQAAPYVVQGPAVPFYDVRMTFLHALVLNQNGDLGVLVVEDEPDIREGIQDLLRSELAGARIFATESGREALQVLQEQKVDLIVTDYKMPGMNGLKFLEEAERVAPGTPRIILTAFDRDLIKELGTAARRERIVQKPFEPETLLEVVRSSLAEAA